MSERTDYSRLLIIIGFTVIVLGAGLTLASSDLGEGFFFVFPFFFWTGSASPFVVGVFVLFTIAAFLLPLFLILRLWHARLNESPNILVCAVCQKRIAEDASFCPYCGNPVTTQDETYGI